MSKDANNVAAAGRCSDGEAAALSGVRVMGPCIAMGAAAAHALDLAGSGSVHEIDPAALLTSRRMRSGIAQRAPLPAPFPFREDISRRSPTCVPER